MSSSQGFEFRSSFSNRVMSAFKPFASHTTPPNQPIPPHRSSNQGTPSGPGTQSTAQAPIGQSSYCGVGTAATAAAAAAAGVPRGQSPDIGYVSLEHPSRSVSYASQISTQFGSQPPPPPPPSEEIRTHGRSSGIHDVSTDSTAYCSSLGSVYSCSNSLTSTRSDSNFEGQGHHPRSPGEDDEGTRQGVYSKAVNGFRGKGESVAETPKPSRRIRMVAHSSLSSSSSKDSNLSISDLRNILVIRETELRMLRDTMVKNESAILQVFEDKKRRWQMEMADRKAEWQHQLEAANSRSWKAEQLLRFQVAKLHQENKRLQAQADELTGDKRRLSDRCHSLERQLDALKTDMRGLLADVSTKDCDVIRSSAIDADRYKIAAANCSTEVEAGSEVTAGVNARSKRRGDPSYRDTAGALGAATELRRELDAARRAVESGRAEFERERQGWALEKEKVVDYQKRLQFVYLQVLHKNRLLELDVQQLTGEMAALDVRQLTGSDKTLQPAKQLGL